MTPEWELSHVVVENKELPGSHIADHLAELSLMEWNIPLDKVSCFTMDNGANILKAINKVLD